TAEPGTEYALSVETWSPYLELWRLDGAAVTYTEINCLGQHDATGGTIEGEDITWDGSSPIHGAGTGSTTYLSELTDTTLHRSGARESATTDVEGQLTAHVERCEAAGETLGGILLD